MMGKYVLIILLNLASVCNAAAGYKNGNGGGTLAASLTGGLSVEKDGAGVTVTEKNGLVSIGNSIVKVEYDLKKGVYDAVDKRQNVTVIQDAYSRFDHLTTTMPGIIHTWESVAIDDELGKGKMLLIKSSAGGSPVQLLGFTLYENKGFIVLSAGVKNTTEQPFRLKKILPLMGGAAFKGFKTNENFRMLDGNSGAFDTKVIHKGTLDCKNNGLATFGQPGHTRSLVMGGLTYHDFAKYVKITPKDGFLLPELFAADSVGRRIDPGAQYLPDDRFYIDFMTDNPFDALEQYALCVRDAQKVRLSAYNFPTVCLWWVGVTSGKPVNTTPGAVEVMTRIKNSGFLKYSPVGIRLVPDDWATQQGWWDDEHWQKWNESAAGTYKAPYETTAKWAGAVTSLGGIPITYFQASVVTKSYAEKFPEYTLFNAGNYKPFEGDYNEWSYNPLVGYDFTDSGFIRHMQEVYANLNKGGVRGLMFDYPGTGWKTRGGFDDPYATTASHYRNIFKLAKEGLGPRSYVHERGVEVGLDVTLGYVDSQRTEWDASGFNPGIVSRAALRWYKNRVVINYDTDSKDLLIPMSRDERRSMLTISYLVSGRLLLPNDFGDLSRDIIHDLSRLYPQHAVPRSARPVDAFLREHPQVYDFVVSPQWHQVAFYNTSDTSETKIGVSLAGDPAFGALGLDPDKSYYVYDFWDDMYLGRFRGAERLEQNLRPGETRMMSVREDVGHPQLISTNRHILQGAVDTENIQWDDNRKILSGIFKVVAEDPYKAVIKLPEDREWMIKSAGIIGAGGVTYKAQKNEFDKTVEFTIESPENADVKWEIAFSVSGKDHDLVAPMPVKNLTAHVDGLSDVIRLSWDAASDDSGKVRYQVFRGEGADGEPSDFTLTGIVYDTAFTDINAGFGKTYVYRVIAQDPAGNKSEPSVTSVKIPAPDDVVLVRKDDQTSGSWRGKYGSSGYRLINYNGKAYQLDDLDKLPGYIESLTQNGVAAHTGVSSDKRYLEDPEEKGRKLGAVWAFSELKIDLKPTDKNRHLVSLYFVDEEGGREQLIRFLDGETGRLLSTPYRLKNFEKGKYVQYQFAGPVRISIVRKKGHYSTVNAIFFDEPD
ncbi:MAG: fibronectin type III domain-containing protein [Prolixibacteraceae bacterium]|jgi:hypothetical protein|nr:fibronectin type III domain-containing protein [Prolixibacteraceae bacterium]